MHNIERTARRHFIASGIALGMAAHPAWAASPAITRVLVLGDSLSAEYGLPKGSGWVALLEERLRRQSPQVQVRNASISGETTAGGRARLPALLKQHQPEVVVIELGGNDALRGLPMAGTRSNLLEMTRSAQDAGARVLLLGMQMPPNYGAAYGREFEAVFQGVARERRAALVPFFLRGIADASDPLTWFQADRIHPSAKAQPLMLENVWPALQALLKP